MEGIVALAMEKKAPHWITIGAVPGTVEDWCSELSRDCHLLYFDLLPDAPQTEQLCQILLKRTAEPVDGYFAVPPHEAVRALLSVKEYLQGEVAKAPEPEQEEELSQEQKDLAEGERLHELAREYENGSLKVIKDPKRAFALYKQSAELGYPWAFLDLSRRFCEGIGTKQDLNTALQWAYKCIEPNMPTPIRLFGFEYAAECFLAGEMNKEAEQTWLRCFAEMAEEFEETNTSALQILADYGFWVWAKKIPAIHSIGIAALFPTVAAMIRSKAQGRDLSDVERYKVRWLTENSPS